MKVLKAQITGLRSLVSEQGGKPHNLQQQKTQPRCTYNSNIRYRQYQTPIRSTSPVKRKLSTKYSTPKRVKSEVVLHNENQKPYRIPKKTVKSPKKVNRK